MCGRYATTRSEADLSDLFDAIDVTEGLTPSWNVAPTDPVPLVRVSASRGARVLDTARWGLVPPWATDLRGGARMINARSETVATSPAFAPAFARRRCLVPADGWFEWLGTGKQKQAFYMTPADGSVVAFAGLWSAWGPESLLTCTVLTTAARGALARVHDRMPLILPRDRWAAWLADGDDPAGGGYEAGRGGYEAGHGGYEAGRGGSEAGHGGPAGSQAGHGGPVGVNRAARGGPAGGNRLGRGDPAGGGGQAGRGGSAGGGGEVGRGGSAGGGGEVGRGGSAGGGQAGRGGPADGLDPISLLQPMTERELAAIEVRPVGPAVGNVRNNGAHLLDPPLDSTLF